ncbi:MAG: phage major capsid protein [Thermoleophilia bacterium]
MQTETKALVGEVMDAVNGFKSRYEERLDRIADTVDGLELKLKGSHETRIEGDSPTRSRAAAIPGRGELLRAGHKMAALPDIREKSRDAGDGPTRLGALVNAAATGASKLDLSDAEHKALAGSTGSGQYTLAPGLASGIIDNARNESRVIEAGALTFPMTDPTMYLPRLTDDPQGAWRAEGSAVAIDDPTFDRITLTAQTCSVIVKLSYELFEDTSDAGYAAIENSIVKALALKLDYAALMGSGVDNEPQGIFGTSGVNVVSLATNGATPGDYDFFIDAMADVEAANGTPTAAIYSPRTAKTLRKLTTGISGDKTKLQMPESVRALRHLTTNQVPDNLDHGTAAGVCSTAFVGDFSQVIIGVRPEFGFRVQRLNELYAGTMQIGLLAWFRADIAVARPNHLTVVKGIKA